MNIFPKQIILSFIAYWLLLFAYGVWSYALTDPNLVLTSWQQYWNFQQWMWSWDKQSVTLIYIGIISLLFLFYFLLLKNFKFQISNFKIEESLLPIALCLIPLLFSYNALSHDVFNYMFNARMVVNYGADPHVQTALQFVQDDWVRFMHNVHTPAPYFYGWTGLSLIPYVLGFGKFITIWLAFRLWSVVGLLLIVCAQLKLVEKFKLGEKGKWWVMAFALNPLVLIEVVSNSHNDAWMMGLGISSLFIVSQISNFKFSTFKIGTIVGSLILLLFSISTKYVTVSMVPVWVFLLISNYKLSLPRNAENFLARIRPYIFDLTALLMFIPLFTARSQQFHPWYLIWSLTFIPFMKIGWWRNALLVLSVSSLFRYVPWMWNGAFEFNDQIQLQQKLITWVPLGVFGILVVGRKFVWWLERRE